MKTHLKIFTTILSVLACCAFLPTMQAQLPPEIPGNPDGCYPAFTTAEGCNALHQLFGGLGNTGVGWYSLFLAGDGSFNTGVGAGTLALTSRTGVGTDANSNTAVGTAAMILNLSGSQNTAVGTNALVNNMIAIGNNGVGSFVLYNNDSSGAGSANGNNAFGHAALFSNIDGAGNCAFGDDALFPVLSPAITLPLAIWRSLVMTSSEPAMPSTTRQLALARSPKTLNPVITPRWVPRRSCIMT